MTNFLANWDNGLFDDREFPEEDEVEKIKAKLNKIPKKKTQTNQNWEEIIDINAILEATLGTMAWGEAYIHNQFPYILVYREDIDDDDYKVSSLSRL